MKKNMVFNIIVALGILLAGVLKLLNVLPATSESFAKFNLGVCVAIATGIAAVIFLLRGVLEKTRVEFRQMFVVMGAGLAVATVISAIVGFTLPSNIILPMIVVVLALALVLMLMAKGTRRWDKGDNQDPNYKNYNQRKAEEAAKASQKADVVVATELDTTTK